MNEEQSQSNCSSSHGSTALLPCPFCGEVATKLKHNDLYRIHHLAACWFSGKDFSHRASLLEPDEVEEWNRRDVNSCSHGCKIKRAVKEMNDNLTDDY